MAITSPTSRERLQPYLPRLTLQWLADEPERLHRAVEGSMVFIDISGFTALSEKLAKLGRVGAEEMADAINACFSELLVLAYEGDGSLLKFGGDALLLLFEGEAPEQTARRAAKAAFGMRRRLREVGQIQTPGGRVKLRMSVGVHTGRFDFFLVGGSHRELLVTGPAATEVVEMEGTAGAGEIVISPATAELLPASSSGASKGAGVLLRSAPSAPAADALSVVVDVPDALLHESVPVATRESLLAGVIEPEHRQVGIGFVHFDGTDDLIRRQGPDAAAAELDRLVRETQEAIDGLGVSFLSSDVDHNGGKLILAAGAPRAVGDDDERLLLALRRIADVERAIPIRIGVNHGPVFAGDIGPHYRRTYTVMGDAVNLAARLMAKAGPAEIYASDAVLERSSTRFETAELEPFMVKGKAKPVHAWSLGVPLGRPKHTAAEEYELVGRRDEMRMLRAAMNDARGNRRRTIVIESEAGMGKTRLLDEVLKGCQDFRGTGATSETFTATTPYIAWRDVLRELIGAQWEDTSEVVVGRLQELAARHDPSLLPWLPLVATAADAEMESTPEVDALGDEFRRARLHQAVVDFLRAVATERTLFAFEDVQLMDEASADLLTAIVDDERDDRPWLILALRRPEGDGFSPPAGPTVERLDLAPLPTDVTREFAIEVTDDAPLAGHILEQIVERSNGNPQLLLDLVHAARSGEEDLPDSVEAAATVRIDALTPHDRQLVRRVSVFGLAFHPRFLPDVLDAQSPAPDDATWERLAEFFEPEGGGYLRFRRAVIRDAAYGGLPFRTRQRLHQAVGLRWERELPPSPEENAGLLSLHFSLAGEHERAWRYARIAAERAYGIFANAEAASLYERAIRSGRRLGVDPDDLRAAYEQLGLAQQRTGAFDAAGRAFADASRLAKEPIDRAKMMMRRSYVEEAVGSYRRALTWLTKAQTALGELDDHDSRLLRVELDQRAAGILLNQGKLELAANRARLAIAEAESVGATDVLGHACNILGNSLVLLGDPGADAQYRRALDLYRASGFLQGQAMVQLNRGAGAYWEGRWGDATDLYGEGLDLHERTGNPVEAAFARLNLAEIYVEQGRLQEAETELLNASRVMRASGDLTGLAASLSFLGRVSVRAGRLAEAEERYRGAKTAYEQLGAKAGVLEVEALEAEREMAAGLARDGLVRADQVLASRGDEIGIEQLEAMLERTRGYALAQLGEEEDARVAFQTSRTIAMDRDVPYDAALATLGLVRLGDTEDEGGTDLAGDVGATLSELGVVALPAFPMTEAPASPGPLPRS